jgi:hypothetical protein
VAGWLSVGITLFQALSLLFYIGGIWACQFRLNALRRNEPLRCATIEEQRLLALYYPKETFDRDVHLINGCHRKTGTMKDQTGMDRIAELPVFLPELALKFLKKEGNNRAEVICGKKRAYVIRLNDDYHIEALALRVETAQRVSAQWKFGIPGPCLEDEETLILGQRRTTKQERRRLAYEMNEHMPCIRRLLGSCAVVASVLLFWTMAFGWLTAKEWFVPFFFIAITGLLPMVMEKHRPREKVNRVQGVYRKAPDVGMTIGKRRIYAESSAWQQITDHLKEGQTVIAHITVNADKGWYDWVLNVEGLPDTYAGWRYQEHEKWLGNAVMCGLLALSWFVAHLSYPEVDRSNAQAWIEYASGGLCIAYGINLIRRLWQRRPVSDRLSTS